MPKHGKYPDELRERAVRMVLDHQHEYGSQWEAICSVAEKLDLAGANLTGANLTGANLTGADLTGADLTGSF